MDSEWEGSEDMTAWKALGDTHSLLMFPAELASTHRFTPPLGFCPSDTHHHLFLQLPKPSQSLSAFIFS